MSIGTRIRSLREKQGLTQRELAEKMQTAQKNVSAYENDVTIPSATMLKSIAVALETDANYLLDISSKKKTELPLASIMRDIENLPQKEREALLTTIQTFLNAFKKSKNK